MVLALLVPGNGDYNESMKKLLTRLSWIFCLSLLVTVRFNCEAKTVTWQKTYRRDLDFIHKTIEVQTPAYAIHDTDFIVKHKNAWNKALNQKIFSKNTYKVALQRYIDTFNYPSHSHIRLNFRDKLNTFIPKRFVSPTIESIEDGVFWLRIPSFAPQNKLEQEKFACFCNQVKQLRGAKCVVFDVRGNGGGNSAWGVSIIKSLYGEEYWRYIHATYCLKNPPSVAWRVTRENLEHLKNNLNFDDKQELIKNVEDSLEKGLALYIEKNLCKKIPPAKPSMFAGKSLLVTDAKCFSATLAFCEMLLLVDRSVLQVGDTTGRDNAYTEVRTVDLPSGCGRLSFPIKFHVNDGNRDRFFVPAVFLDTSTEPMLKKWVLDNFLIKSHPPLKQGG